MKYVFYCMLVPLALVVGCEAAAVHSARILKERSDLDSVCGLTVVSVLTPEFNSELRRETIINLSDGSKIIIESSKHNHRTKIIKE